MPQIKWEESPPYEGPCPFKPDSKKIPEVFCRAMSRDRVLGRRCKGCPSPYRYQPPSVPKPSKPVGDVKKPSVLKSSELIDDAKEALPLARPESKGDDGVPETPTAKVEAQVVEKPATSPAIFTTVPPTRYGHGPQYLEARARKGQTALEMSDQIDQAAKAEYGGAASMARTLKMSESRAAQLRRLQKLHPEVKKMLEEGHLATGTATALALYSQPVQPVLVEGLKNGKVTVGSLTYGPLHDALKQDKLKQGKLKERMESLGLEWPEQEE